jgi:hypothetical protein
MNILYEKNGKRRRIKEVDTVCIEMTKGATSVLMTENPAAIKNWFGCKTKEGT